ncbi:MAG: NAD(P)/FAD-dependent oxidoreductase [Peptococcaceae bacterium]|nr:NAD(P)/FAD-dependent oxidoreductase [Peptococcaceae bacterium]
MGEAPKSAVIQRDRETYAVVPKISMGMVDADTLARIAEVAKKYNIPIIKLTSAQRMALVGIKEQDVEKVWKDLGMEDGRPVGLCLHYVQACPGTAVCKFGVQPSLTLGAELDRLFSGYELPAKFKIGVSGCPMNCGEAPVRDLGVYGKKSGWTLMFGGSSGSHPRIGDVIAEGLDDGQVLELAKKCMEVYMANARPRERTARFMSRFGVEEFKKAVGITS